MTPEEREKEHARGLHRKIQEIMSGIYKVRPTETEDKSNPKK
jgi:hypothetical protein